MTQPERRVEEALQKDLAALKAALDLLVTEGLEVQA